LGAGGGGLSSKNRTRIGFRPHLLNQTCGSGEESTGWQQRTTNSPKNVNDLCCRPR